MKISIVVPTTNIKRLKILLASLRNQDIKPWEVVVVVKNIETRKVDDLCYIYALNCIVLEQREGYFTKALNMGRRASSGDVVTFTDDDAIALKGWLKRYIKLFGLYKKIGCISSRDIYIDMDRLRLLPTPDDRPTVRLYRILMRPIFEKPLPILRKYWCGVYINKYLEIKHGPCIPNRICYSLPFRGVNMAFRKEAIDEAMFPEHELLRRAPGNEQYVGLQLVLNGWDCLYTPDNPILHMARKSSLSRSAPRDLHNEEAIMRELMRSLLKQRTWSQ